MMADEKTAPSSSSGEYAYDFLDSRSSFGSQLNMKTTSSEFDDLPGFVAGKVLYFVKGVTVQPFSVNYELKLEKTTGIIYNITNQLISSRCGCLACENT
jgi:hypothetical protein